MSYATLILGQSGTGKSSSLRNFNPDNVLLIQAVKKPLPFKSTDWKYLNATGGSVFACDEAPRILNAMHKTKKDIIIIDDFQYILANEFMRRSSEKSFDKFTDIGHNAWNIFRVATMLPDNKRVYILAHTQEDDFGKTKIKTIGKLCDEKIVLEGMVTTVLQTSVINGQYKFMTQNNGNNTVKSPMGMFNDNLIDNDLAMVDKTICEYYGITKQEEQNDV